MVYNLSFVLPFSEQLGQVFLLDNKSIHLKKKTQIGNILYREADLMIQTTQKNEAKARLILAANHSHCEMTFSYPQLLRSVLGIYRAWSLQSWLCP